VPTVPLVALIVGIVLFEALQTIEPVLAKARVLPL
jgi:hypothetical protein